MQDTNEFGQPVGKVVPDWKPRQLPEAVTLTGHTCRLEPLDIKHVDDLFAAYSHSDERYWTYQSIGPFSNMEEFRKYVEIETNNTNMRHYTVIDLNSQKAVGMTALMRIVPDHGEIEVGRVAFSSLMSQSTLSTEAQYLLMTYVFDELGYRRFVWKCDNNNVPSKNAAQRLGFLFEGLFRKYFIVKGHIRDVAQFAITDDRWPMLKTVFQTWLTPNNFDKYGRQIRKLDEIREAERKYENL